MEIGKRYLIFGDYTSMYLQSKLITRATSPSKLTVTDPKTLQYLPPSTGACLARTARRSAPPLFPSQPCADGDAEWQVSQSSLEQRKEIVFTPAPTPAVPATLTPPLAIDETPVRRRWLPRWLYIGWYPPAMALLTFALFAGGSLDYEPAKEVPRWVTPLLLALSGSLPTAWLALTSSERWRALPA